ncbi:MAG: hypothetical protein GXO92_04325 [FCB group bacterium]|nr:hypothetical protein [FCB group bacterium]
MWSSIRQIEFPESLSVANKLADEEGKALFAGGTYLVAEKNPDIHTLVDINHLLERSIEFTNDGITIGAGATLQQIVRTLRDREQSLLAQAARQSCYSKNIRNQRTIGGEIARRKTGSEVVTLLHALNARLRITGETDGNVSIREWNGAGIIEALEIRIGDISANALERFALLPSAAAMVIVAGVRRGAQVEVSVGGRARKVVSLQIPVAEFTDERIAAFSASAVRHFQTDMDGSLRYKQSLIETGLKRVRKQL